MKKLLAVVLLAAATLTASAAVQTVSGPVIAVDEDTVVLAKIDARQNQLIKALLVAKQTARLAPPGH